MQRQWTIDPDDAEINRQLKREVLVFALPVSIFVVSFVIAITYEVVGYNYALLILVAVFNPTALVALLLTVDKELCRRKPCSKCKYKVKQYEVQLKTAHEFEATDYDDSKYHSI